MTVTKSIKATKKPVAGIIAKIHPNKDAISLFSKNLSKRYKKLKIHPQNGINKTIFNA